MMCNLANLFKEYSRKIDSQALQAKKKFLHELVTENAFYEKGQVIDNGTVRIQIDKITPALHFGVVKIVYTGVELTKKNEPKKRSKKASVYANSNHDGIRIIDDARIK